MPGSQADAVAVLEACRARGWRLATAESCTGGLIVGRLTDAAGASDVVEGGVVVYADAQKVRWLRVRADVLKRDGAVSEATARAMAEGCRETFGVDVAIAVTGIAGPGGGSAEKPVGLVHLAVATPAGATHRRAVFAGDRRAVRAATVDAALALVASAAGGGEVA
ncbi:MAG: CinA family protein [Alphaproteobacteria bacterium]